MNAPTVLRVNSVEEQAGYRNAVASIITTIQHCAKKTLIEVAEEIDVSLGTISNAANKKSDLCATYLMRLGQVYGAAYLNPYLALFGAQAQPLEANRQADILPFIARVNLKIAEARDPQGPGGQTEVPQEKHGYLPDLKAVQREIGHLIHEIETAA